MFRSLIDLPGRAFVCMRNPNDFDRKGWGSMGRMFGDDPPAKPGVYIVLRPSGYDAEKDEDIEEIILYIGSSCNLSRRISGHTVISKQRKIYGYVSVLFREFENFLEVELEMIKKYKPTLNITGTGKKRNPYKKKEKING